MVNGMAAAGIPPDLYTAALRAVLVEWAALPGASLASRLQAADALCTIFGMHRDLHEQVRVRVCACVCVGYACVCACNLSCSLCFGRQSLYGCALPSKSDAVIGRWFPHTKWVRGKPSILACSPAEAKQARDGLDRPWASWPPTLPGWLLDVIPGQAWE